MQNTSLKTKLQNIISSEQFCGLCFEYSEENSTDIELEVASDDWSHRIKLRDIYYSVFNESTENLASKIICSKCTDSLIQSYTFIENTKFTSGLLYRCLNDLQTELHRLKHYKNIELDSDNVCIILAGAENKNNERKELHCTLCHKKFGALQDFINHYKEHLRREHVGYLHTDKLKMKDKVTELIIHNLETEKLTSKLTESKMSLFTQDARNKMILEIPKKDNMISRSEMEVTKKSNGIKTQNSMKVLGTEKCIKAKHKVVEEMQCIMCLNVIEGGRDHLCEFKCSTCNDPSCIHFAHLIHFRDEILTKSRAKCLCCDFLCKDKEVIIDHVNRYHLYFKCDLCGQNFTTKLDIETHLTGKHFDCIVQVQNHKDKWDFKTKKGAMRIDTLKDRDQNEITCAICKISFENLTLLKTHQKSHSTLKSHLESSGTTKNDLKFNKKVKPNVTCELCGYITWNNILLECHMNRYHLKIKPYVCHICSKNFVGKHLLKKHIITHTVDQSIICNFCGKKLANLSCLKNHIKLHTGEKNYKCNICGEKFRSASIRSVHRVKKHSAKEAACPLCLSKFFTLVELRKHIIKMHWKKKTKFDPRELDGMENHYHLFHDGRRIKMGDEDVDFYMPC